MNSDSFLNGRSSIFGAMLWMSAVSFVLTLLLHWVPFIGLLIGPVVGGCVGGRRAGSLGRAFLAAILPSVLLGIALMLFVTTVGAFVLGPLAALFGGAAGFIGLIAALSHGGAMVLGALVGGFLRETNPV